MSAPPSLATLLRAAYPRVLARTLAFTHRVPEAEDAVQEAMLRALDTWPRRGVPQSAEAWLLTVARNVHRDRLRKGKWEAPRQDALEALSQMSPWVQAAVGEAEVGRGWKDELLRLLFACWHPALAPGEGAALCLATVIGLSNRELGLAFGVEARAMEQRLTRARRRLWQHGDPDGVYPERALDRLDAVLRVLHLLFNEGYWASGEDAPIRAEPCRLAIGLAHSLAQVYAQQAEVLGLLSLLLLHDARRPARVGPDGEPVPLPLQDRSRYSSPLIAEGLAFLDRAARLGSPGPYQLEAAISAVHCRAARSEDTDWPAIADLYARLERLRPTPAVRVNRAFALGRAQGPEVGLRLLDDRRSIDSGRHAYVHLVRASLLAELGRGDEARRALLGARDVARNRWERAQIEAQLAVLPVRVS